jgi:neutral ceramidase
MRPNTAVLMLAPWLSVYAAAPVVLNPDGAWCWFQDERALVYGGKLSVGSIGRTGDVQVTTWDFKTGLVRVATLHPKFQVDDHNAPGMLLRSDGRLMAFYTEHGGPTASNPMLWRVTTRPGDASEWEPEQSFRAGARNGFSYANPFQLSGEGGRIYLFWRAIDFNPTWSSTDDGGKTWRTAANHIYYESGERPYVKYASNGVDTIHFAYTDGHPGRPFDNNLYYAFYRNGGLYRTDGTFVRKLAEGPLRVAEGTRVYDGRRSPDGEAWVWDMRLDAKGRPVIAYSSHPANMADNRYRYARWNGKEWEDRQIAFGGKRVSVSEKLPAGNYYAGGICLDPDDLNVVYVSSSVNVRDGTPSGNGRLEIWKGVTADGGRGWTWTAITRNSATENMRPIVPVGHPGKTFVLWFRGEYPAYKRYETEVVAFTDAPLPAVRRGVWRAGTARVAVTPRGPIRMAGYGARTKPSDGVASELYAGALALEDESGKLAVIVTADTLGFTRPMADEIARRCRVRYGIERDRVLLNASHTHSGPLTGQLGRPNYMLAEAEAAVVRRYTAKFLDQVIEVVGVAIGNLAPARLSFGQGLAGFAVNRRRAQLSRSVPGPVDHDVPVLAVRGEDGALRAVVAGYACHAAVLGGQRISADWPGAFREATEKVHAGASAFFLNGCGADANPMPRRDEALAATYGEILSSAVQQVLAGRMQPVGGVLRAALDFADVRYQTPPTREQLRVELEDASEVRRNHARMLLSLLDSAGKLPESYPHAVQVWQFGRDLKLIAFGSEVVVDYALRLKREYGWDKTWVASYSNDFAGYIPSARVVREGGYEGGGAMRGQDHPGPYTEAVEETLIGKVRELVRRTME